MFSSAGFVKMTWLNEVLHLECSVHANNKSPMRVLRMACKRREFIEIEYEGKSFSSWNVSSSCRAQNSSSPRTKLHCVSPGIHTITPSVNNQTHNANGLFVVPVQLKIKSGFGVGAWLSPSLTPSMLVKSLKSIFLYSQIKEESRHLSVDKSHICFMWYYTVLDIYENLTQAKNSPLYHMPHFVCPSMTAGLFRLWGYYEIH
ncbi:hypothetical protein STEG23_000011, partial [Scotinomys teguina]